MEKIHNKLIVSLVITIFMIAMVPDAASAAVPTKVGLGTTSSFAVLAGTSITNTGTTIITGDAGGDVGLSPGTEFTGQASVTLSGATHLADTAANIAQADLITAYNDAAGRTATNEVSGDLGGGATLYPGVYYSASSIGLSGTLTLDAMGDPEAAFIFQAGSTLITAANSQIILTNGARYCRVFWQVGSSATLGVNSLFVGHIFAMTSITADTGATIQGQLLARNGSVTLHGNTITNGVCLAEAVVQPLIEVVKIPDTLALASSGGPVKYTYKVTNPGMVALSDVTVTDDKVSTVTYVSGDANLDSLLQPSETWIYTSTATLIQTTTNTATATGKANGLTASDIASATVVVLSPDIPIWPIIPTSPAVSPSPVVSSSPVVSPSPVIPSSPVVSPSPAIPTSPVIPSSPVVPTTPVVPPSPSDSTVTGGQLPDTATPWYNILLLGAGLITLGVVGFVLTKKHE